VHALKGKFEHEDGEGLHEKLDLTVPWSRAEDFAAAHIVRNEISDRFSSVHTVFSYFDVEPSRCVTLLVDPSIEPTQAWPSDDDSAAVIEEGEVSYEPRVDEAVWTLSEVQAVR